MKKTFLLAVLLLLGFALQSQSLAHSREARFGKGINLSNWLEADWLGSAWPQPARYTKQDLQAAKDAGMQTIRLPFCFALLTDTLPPHDVNFNHPAIAWLDSTIQWCADLQLNLIIDNQHEWDLTNDNFQDKIPPMTAMWRQVVQHYSYLDPERYFFEVLNEPPAGLLPANADAVNLACIDTIRAYNQSHTLIVGPHTASIGSSFLTFNPYPDTNLIYTFHTYEPLYFTHQGFSWFPVPFPTGTVFPFLGDDALVRNSLQAVADWRNTHNRPVFMGEFGVGINADDDSRCRWVTLMGELIDNLEFNWCYWDWGGVAPSDFTMFGSLPPTGNSIEPCFAEALHLYEATDRTDLEEWTWLKIGPNPVGERLVLEAGEGGRRIVRVEVWDVSGKRLALKEVAGKRRVEVQLDKLPAGLWIVEVEDKGGHVLRKKLVKE